ncbi:MAG: hypothetical protein LUH82_08280 [Clostridiales bacterium]|nr:hypothetical protein [Clostridiales bacterium]
MKRLKSGILAGAVIAALIISCCFTAFAMDTAYLDSSAWRNNSNATSVNFEKTNISGTYSYYYDSAHGCFYLRIAFQTVASTANCNVIVPFVIENALNKYEFAVDSNGDLVNCAESVADNISASANMGGLYIYQTGSSYTVTGNVYIGVELLKSEDKKTDCDINFKLNVGGRIYKLLEDDITLKNEVETTTAATTAKVTTTKVTTTKVTTTKVTTTKVTTTKSATTKATTTKIATTKATTTAASAAAQATTAGATKYTAPATTAGTVTAGSTAATQSTAANTAEQTTQYLPESSGAYSQAAAAAQSTDSAVAATTKYSAVYVQSGETDTAQYDAETVSGSEGEYAVAGSESAAEEPDQSGYYTATTTKNTLSKPAVILLIIAAVIIISGLALIIISFIKRRKENEMKTPAEIKPGGEETAESEGADEETAEIEPGEKENAPDKNGGTQS